MAAEIVPKSTANLGTVGVLAVYLFMFMFLGRDPLWNRDFL